MTCGCYLAAGLGLLGGSGALTPSLTAAREPPFVSYHLPPVSGHLLCTALVSPGCLEDIGSGTVTVLQCPHVWGSYPEEREFLVFIT